MTALIPPYRIKLERVKHHIEELEQSIREYWATKPYVSLWEIDESANVKNLKVRIVSPIPQGWSAIVGDAIHNARTCLDILMVEAVRKCNPGQRSYNHVYFVISESRTKFLKVLPSKTLGASTRVHEIIKKLQPYQGGDDRFWRLHQLDILDKHKSIIPVGSALHSVGLAVSARPVVPEWDTLSFEERSKMTSILKFQVADRLFPLKDGDVIFTMQNSPDDFFETDFFQSEIQIAFGEGQIYDGESVIPELNKISSFIEEIVTIFENQILM